MKTSKLIAILLVGMTAFHNANAQDSIIFKSKYQCWMYSDSAYAFSGRMGVIYSVMDSGIHFAASASESTFRTDDMQLQFVPVSKIDYINVRKKGSVAKGAIIGLGIGGVFGFGLIYTALKTSKGSGHWTVQPEHHSDVGAYIFIGGFSLLGAGIGALIGSQTFQFEINRKQRNYKRQKEEIRRYAIIQ